jgi:hypothetical protein
MRGATQVAFAAVAIAAAGLVVACCIIARSDLHGRTELMHTPRRSNSLRRNVLYGKEQIHRNVLHVAKQLHSESVPKSLAMKAAKAFTKIEQLCGGTAGSHKKQAEMDRYRQRADQNWWAAIRHFNTEDEVKQAVMSDPRHVHLLVFVAPGWCSWSQKQLKELQENFDDFGEAADRVHLIDVDNPANKQLVQFEGVTSFPTIVVVQGNNILVWPFSCHRFHCACNVPSLSCIHRILVLSSADCDVRLACRGRQMASKTSIRFTILRSSTPRSVLLKILSPKQSFQQAALAHSYEEWVFLSHVDLRLSPSQPLTSSPPPSPFSLDE